jgi:hypothetical protein
MVLKRILIARIKGGLGNQLFCYASARRLAYINNAELVLDSVSGFSRDKLYKRRYVLDSFSIPARLATPRERGEPFERLQRGFNKLISRFSRYEYQSYIQELSQEFDARLLRFKLQSKITTIDGLWQSYHYFSDIENIIRDDLKINLLPNERNLHAVNWIKNNNVIAIHIRWFGEKNSKFNLPIIYYKKAIEIVSKKINNPCFAIFSDNPSAALELFDIPRDKLLLVDWNAHDGGELIDLWLMSHCVHFIMANSTFSWWGCWLGGRMPNDRLVFFPRSKNPKIDEWTAAWDFKGQMPNMWKPIIV